MPTLKAHIHVADDHTISGIAPADLPAGDHDALITVARRPRRRVADLPAHPGPWGIDGISLHRADMYDDSGR